ncbi:MAG: aminomethyl-transferring glycine dehydrogenase subunit GcvPA [Deltaproteobacteria bacterium]|nr:aminomethyl-transferring glycine dehydrogenase subunit GcvPA [Deltaproteobacteria bacterium]
MRYLPQTDDELRAMLGAIGVPSVDALFATIPPEGRLGRALDIAPGEDEVTLMGRLEALAARNDGATMLSFQGAGCYHHHTPPVADQLLLRGEFLTAYTPYQPEVAQGTLQSVFEFQTIVSEVLGLPVANASMYDGASALAEGALMARRLTGRGAVVASRALHPEYREVVRTYLAGIPGARYEEVPFDGAGVTDLAALEGALGSDTAAVLVGYPNFFGRVEDVARCAALAHARGAHLVTATWETNALSVLEPPGALGADVATGEAQPLGIPPQFGGPGCGIIACGAGREVLQQLPGRLVGETVDAAGRRGYVLTLSTREQHIRRERATSNICTNQGLMALLVTICMALRGRSGWQTLGRLCLSRAEYLKKALGAAGLPVLFEGATFNEFAVKLPVPAREAISRCAASGLLPGVDLGRWYPELSHGLLVAVTERHGRADLDRLVAALQALR